MKTKNEVTEKQMGQLTNCVMHWDDYIEPSEELKPAVDLLLRIGKDKELRSVFEQLVKTKEFAECLIKYHKYF
jgi:hypothetical protein